VLTVTTLMLTVPTFVLTVTLAVAAMSMQSTQLVGGGDNPADELGNAASVLRKFSRCASQQEKEKRAALRSNSLRNQFRAEWDATWVKAKATKGVLRGDITTSSSELKTSIYKPFAMIVKDQGGQIDLASAVRAAANICAKFERRGPPFIMYNRDAERIEYMSVTRGVKEVTTRSNSVTEEAEYELTPELWDACQNDAQELGLVGEIPDDSYGKFELGTRTPVRAVADGGTPMRALADSRLTSPRISSSGDQHSEVDWSDGMAYTDGMSDTWSDTSMQQVDQTPRPPWMMASRRPNAASPAAGHDEPKYIPHPRHGALEGPTRPIYLMGKTP
jgi:hypothetical protein